MQLEEIRKRSFWVILMRGPDLGTFLYELSVKVRLKFEFRPRTCQQSLNKHLNWTKNRTLKNGIRNMPDVWFTLKIYVHTFRIYEGQRRTDESPSFEKYTYGSYVGTVTIFDESWADYLSQGLEEKKISFFHFQPFFYGIFWWR